MHNYITIKETEDWIVDYNTRTGEYCISYFEDGHFKDEVVFMKQKKPRRNNKEEHILVCPHCKVCSIMLTKDEYDLVNSGQQLVEVCQVCGKEVILDDRDL